MINKLANPGETQAIGWCSENYHQKRDLLYCAGIFAVMTVLIGAPAVALLLVANFFILMVSLVTGEPPDWVAYDDGTTGIFALIITTFWAFTSLFVFLSKDVIRYDIDVKTEQVVLHQSRFPNRLKVIAIPFSSIVSIAPYTPRSNAETGGFYFMYLNDSGQPDEWKTRNTIALDVLQAHVDALRATFGDRLHDWIHHHP